MRNLGVHLLVNGVVLDLVERGFKIALQFDVNRGELAESDKVLHEVDVGDDLLLDACLQAQVDHLIGFARLGESQRVGDVGKRRVDVSAEAFDHHGKEAFVEDHHAVREHEGLCTQDGHDLQCALVVLVEDPNAELAVVLLAIRTNEGARWVLALVGKKKDAPRDF